MTLRSCAVFAALPLVCLACSSDPAQPPAPGNSGGQQATAGGGSGGGGGTPAGGGGQGGGTVSAGSGGMSAGSGGGPTGGSAGSGGSGGSGGAVGGPVTPTEAGGKYTWSYGDVVFEVDAMVAGRIITFSKGGTNVIDDGVDNYYGSTLWLGPEGQYGLSPEGIDNGTFTPTMQGATLVLTGPLDAPSGFSASKSFAVDSALDRVEIVYTIKNETAADPVAAWEVTRVAHSGITFYPAPTAGMDAGFGAINYDYDAVAHINWIDHAEALAGPGKLFQDGGGWIAHAEGTLLFKKTFPDLQPADFPDPDTEVEIFINPDEAYTELENFGAITTLAAGTSLTYTVQWYLRSIPGTVTVASQSQTLFDFAAAIQ